MKHLADGSRVRGLLRVIVLSSLLSSLALLASQFASGDPSRPVRYTTAFLLLLTAAASWTLSIAGDSSRPLRRSLQIVYWAACWLSAVHYLVHAGFEPGFYRLSDVMAYEAGVPFGHRLLFVWAANCSRALIGDMPSTFYFYLTQAVASFAAGYALYRFTCLFTERRFAALSGIIATVMWMTTYTYYTFYDIGIIGAFAAGMFCIIEKRWKAYLLLFSVATLNHEIVALLIPVGAFLQTRQGIPARRIAALVIAQIVIYSAIRLTMFAVLPQPAAFFLRPATNLELITTELGYVVKSTWKLALLFAVSMLGFRFVEHRLRPVLLLFPLLVATTTLFGRYSEARQFDAFIPVAVAFMVCLARESFARRAGTNCLRPVDGGRASSEFR